MDGLILGLADDEGLTLELTDLDIDELTPKLGLIDLDIDADGLTLGLIDLDIDADGLTLGLIDLDIEALGILTSNTNKSTCTVSPIEYH